MSEFVAGFSARHDAAADILARAFSPRTGFAPRDVAPRAPEAPVSFSPQSGPRHFSPADRDANPTEGWDPFDPQPHASPSTADLVDLARAEGHAAGRAEALAEAAATAARDHALLQQVSAALADGNRYDRDRMATRLRQTVLHLVRRLVGEAEIAPDLLAGRISAATDLLADSAESALLRVHPDDVVLLDGRLPKSVFAVGDATVTRGSFVLESASTIVEDGPDLWLDQLSQTIDRIAVPPLC